MGAKPSGNMNSKGANKLLISYIEKGLPAKQQTGSSITPESYRGCVSAGSTAMLELWQLTGNTLMLWWEMDTCAQRKYESQKQMSDHSRDLIISSVTTNGSHQAEETATQSFSLFFCLFFFFFVIKEALKKSCSIWGLQLFYIQLFFLCQVSWSRQICSGVI